MGEKIKYGVCNVHCAPATIASTGAATYGTVFDMPGCVSITLDQESEKTVFYADNIEYWIGMNNHGYSGSIEFAVIPDKFKTDILGYLVDNKGVLLEDADAPIQHFALMFEFNTDKNPNRYVFYKVSLAQRPNVASETVDVTSDLTVQTETVRFKAMPQKSEVEIGGIKSHLVKAFTGADVDSQAYNDFYSAVYIPSFGGESS